MLHVSRSERNERMQICKACPHLEDGFCGGKPRVGWGGVALGKTLEDRTSLCGCIMAAKTWLKWASCPIGKWGKLSELDREQVRQALEVALRGVNRDNEAEVLEAYQKFIGNPPKSLRCGSCLRGVVEELRSLL